MFAGLGCLHYLRSLPPEELMPTILKVSIGASIAFFMEISEFLVVTYTSSLTLSISGIIKEMCILILAVEVNGDALTPVNIIGLSLCLLGIFWHMFHKLYDMSSGVTSSARARHSETFEATSRSRLDQSEHHQPLLGNEAKYHSDNAQNFNLHQLYDMSSSVTSSARARHSETFEATSRSRLDQSEHHQPLLGNEAKHHSDTVPTSNLHQLYDMSSSVTSSARARHSETFEATSRSRLDQSEHHQPLLGNEAKHHSVTVPNSNLHQLYDMSSSVTSSARARHSETFEATGRSRLDQSEHHQPLLGNEAKHHSDGEQIVLTQQLPATLTRSSVHLVEPDHQGCVKPFRPNTSWANVLNSDTLKQLADRGSTRLASRSTTSLPWERSETPERQRAGLQPSTSSGAATSELNLITIQRSLRRGQEEFIDQLTYDF